MTDIHCHILPGVDDGSRSLEMTRNILTACVGEGVNKVICTPHQGVALHRTEQLRREFSRLKEQVADFPVKLLLGSEIYYYEDMVAHLNDGLLLTMNGTRYVLVEFSPRAEMVYIPDAVYELSVAGYIPIVAHVERYGYLKYESYGEIKSNGGLLQVNAASFEKKDHAKLLRYLLKKGFLDFISSDCHSDGRRNVDFSAARAYIAKKFPRSYVKFFGGNDMFG